MAKCLNFNFEGKDYTLEFNKTTVATMERQGFNLQEVDTKPMLTLPKLFQGAFMMHHSSIRNEKIDKIYDSMGNKTELISKLAEMYQDTVATLMDESENEEGNIQWKVNW